MYRNEKQFKSQPKRPISVIPFPEILSIRSRHFKAEKMLKCNNAAPIGGTDTVYVMEISLKRSYQMIKRVIWKFEHHQFDDKPAALDCSKDQCFYFVHGNRDLIHDWKELTQICFNSHFYD